MKSTLIKVLNSRHIKHSISSTKCYHNVETMRLNALLEGITFRVRNTKETKHIVYIDYNRQSYVYDFNESTFESVLNHFINIHF